MHRSNIGVLFCLILVCLNLKEIGGIFVAEQDGSDI